MDTNQNTANNYQINTFVKGMNSDTSYDMIGADQYLFGLNIRITNNTLLFGDLDSNNTEMVVAPVVAGKSTGSSYIANVDKILAVDSIDNVGVIIVKNSNANDQGVHTWSVYKTKYDLKEEDKVTFDLIYTSTDEPKLDKFSTVMIKEVEKKDTEITKVYIADGQGAPICLFVEGGIDVTGIHEDYLRTNSYFPSTKPGIQRTSGNLKTQQAQYAYRFYLRHGYVSKLSPLTNKIQVINDNRDAEEGNAENTLSNIGFNIFIEQPKVNIFDHVQVYRISYIAYGQSPEIRLIYDKQFKSEDFKIVSQLDDSKRFMTVLDSGSVELSSLSLDEFASLNSQTIIPNILESNLGYLFCGNTKDGSAVIDDTLDNISISVKQINGRIKINECGDGEVPHVTEVDDVTTLNDYTKIEDDEDVALSTYLKHCGICVLDSNGSIAKASYKDIFISSLFRSHRRFEKYYYGIVYYDKYGNRSQVIPIGMTNDGLDTTIFCNDTIDRTDIANVLGLKLQIPASEITNLKGLNIVGFEVVRQEKNFNTTENLLLVALSRPSRLGQYDKEDYRTPYYPNVLLTTQFLYSWFPDLNSDATFEEDGRTKEDLWSLYFDHNGQNVENFNLYLIFAPQINLFRNDAKASITSSCFLTPLYYISELEDDPKKSLSMKLMREGTAVLLYLVSNVNISSSINSLENVHKIQNGVYLLNNLNFKRHDKITSGVIVSLSKLAARLNDPGFELESLNISSIGDVKNPNWEDAFTNIQHASSTDMAVASAVKSYKAYNTTISLFEYNNWVSNSMYDLAVSEDEADAQPGNRGVEEEGTGSQQSWVFHKKEYDPLPNNKGFRGWIGPGPVCLLLAIQTPSQNSVLSKLYYSVDGSDVKMPLGTIIANIKHNPTKYSERDPYFGFGNYFELPEKNEDFSCYVFDGDVYNNYAEIVNMFKTYDFNDQKRTLDSGQVVYYIPMESEINVEFDYGRNYRNTSSANLLLEPGKINGIVSQDRPLHQYNKIYSDNNWSINAFYTKPQDEQYNIYPQRICYSQLKTNGEAIDSWLIFKPADFIDTDSRYGGVTELLSRDNTLYFWLTCAFGKLSVNERSLVTDNNGDTIQLGQGGVLQRVDYLSTKYGMRKQDYCAVNTEDALYWIDILNKAILVCRQNQVTNYGEQLNVQNIINKYIYADDDTTHPYIHYDLQTNELLCQCLREKQEDNTYKNKQLIFNTKYNIATSLYTRNYNDIILFNNVLISLLQNSTNVFPNQLNYLNDISGYLAPTILSFVVNSSASQTKVFDNQKIVTLNRNDWEEEEYEDSEDNKHIKSKTFWNKQGSYETAYIQSKEYEFSTDIRSTDNKPNAVTDREGNITYDIPRTGKNDWGDRLRGKWMKETIVDNQPKQDYCISHIITKFRQSYS